MEYILNNEALQFIWLALRKPTSSFNLERARKQLQNIVKKGWAFRSEVEDLLYYLDHRFSFQIDVIEFSKMFGIHWESVFFRPNTKSNSVSEYDAIRAEEAALLLIIMERIGFRTEPTILTDYLLPHIKTHNKKVLNGAELEIFWFGKTRHKYSKITLKTDYVSATIKEIDNFKSGDNYTLLVKGTDGRSPQLIEISSAKFRRRPEPRLTICKHCGDQWYKGDPDSSARHRKEHKLRMHYLHPKPLINMLNEFNCGEDPELVTTSSAPWKHKEIYIRARAFRKEFHYDFIQWQSEKGNKDPYVQGFLFTNQSRAIVGACSFKRCETKVNSKRWTLDWVWICPQERRKGHFSSRWKEFRRRFGDFSLTFPVSDDMLAFLSKQGDTALLDH